MTEKEIRTRMVQKHDIEENWIKAINFTPKKGELIVYDPDENYDYSRIKIGDGTNTVNELPFVIDDAVRYVEQTLTEAQKAQARQNIGVPELLSGSTDTITPAQVSEALRAGRDVCIKHTHFRYGDIYFTGFAEAPSLDLVASYGVQSMDSTINPGTIVIMLFSLSGSLSGNVWKFEFYKLLKYDDIPECLPNPNALTFTGAVSATYDGSEAKTIEIPDALSDLTADSTHRTVTDTEKSAWNAKANTSDIPTKVSQLTNDSKYLTSYTETDPTVPAWAKAANKPSYTKSEIGLGNVENVKQYSANNPPPYPVTSVNGKTGDVILDITVSEANTIPDYWQAELDTGVDAINAALEQAGRNKSSFLWYHDSHWTDNSKMSPKLLKYLQDNTALNKVNYGGDIVNTETASSRDDWNYIYEWRNAVRGLKNHHSVRGNHDDDIPGLNSDKAKYAFLMAAEETPDIVRGGDFYYYIDDVNEKTRYLYLDTQICTTLTNKGDPLAVQFVVEALNTTPDKWHIVPISHIWFLYDDYNTPKVGQIPDYCQQLFSVFDAYNEKSSSSVTVNGTVVSYDFTNAVGKVEFCIGGHTHVDMDFTTNGGIPVILTEADCYETRGGYSCAPGTIGESAVDGIIADYDAKKISVIRIGRGESREVALGGGINNVLMKSIASTGEIFNGGKGWAADSRIGQTKVLEGYIGSGNYYVSGYIPIDPTVNTTVRMKNISFDKSRTSDIGVAFYGTDFMRCDFRYDGSNDDFLTPARMFGDYMNLSPVLDGTNVVEFTLTTADHLHSGIKYIAICADYIGDDSIITINEPIE